jgi:hypothetical protein
MKKSLIIYLFYMLILSISANAQYIGGNYDGYSSTTWNTPESATLTYSWNLGGNYDGYSSTTWNTPESATLTYSWNLGGNYDGYSSTTWNTPESATLTYPWNLGGNYDGYSVSSFYSATVITSAMSDIQSNSAKCGGNVIIGSSDITTRGVCWNTSDTPTTANSKTTDGSGSGSFTSNLTGLISNTTYYVRAYASNTVGTSYGNEQTFTTLEDVCPSNKSLQDLSYNTTATFTYRASSTITTGGSGTSFTVNNGMVILIAGSKIILNPVTKVSAGAKFRALINGSPCDYTPREVFPIPEEKLIVDNISPQTGNCFILYPNPNEGSFILKKISNNCNIRKISIDNLINTVMEINSNMDGNELYFDIHTLPKGVYFIKAELDGDIQVEKIILR